MPKRLLLCGATGFIGRNLLRHFLEKPEYEIVATYHKTSPPENLLREKKVQFIEVDLTRPDDVHKAVRGADTVI